MSPRWGLGCEDSRPSINMSPRWGFASVLTQASIYVNMLKTIGVRQMLFLNLREILQVPQVFPQKATNRVHREAI